MIIATSIGSVFIFIQSLNWQLRSKYRLRRRSMNTHEGDLINFRGTVTDYQLTGPQIGSLAYESRVCDHHDISVRVYKFELAARRVERRGYFTGVKTCLDERRSCRRYVVRVNVEEHRVRVGDYRLRRR